MARLAPPKCPFCIPESGRVFHVDKLVVGLWDAFPASDGHALVVTKRHIASWFDATAAERAALTKAIDTVRATIEKKHKPAGYNIGVNVGDAAGQTVPHLHVHVIPRYPGDVADPRGGVRHVIPGKGNYLDAPAEAPPRSRAASPRRGAPGAPLARWHQYMRADIPAALGLESDPAFRSQAFFLKGSHMFLLVTLEKEGGPGADRFVSPELFEWHGKGASKQADAIREHAARGIAVHLFARRNAKTVAGTTPYTYCGEVEFAEWVSDRPPTVRWRLREPLPPGAL